VRIGVREQRVSDPRLGLGVGCRARRRVLWQGFSTEIVQQGKYRGKGMVGLRAE
jgi:hypothetical protein